MVYFAAVVIVVVAWWWLWGKRRQEAPSKLPASAAAAARMFDEAYSRTFSTSAACDERTVLDLTRLRDFVVGAVHDRRMSLPNDMAADAAELALAESTEDYMTACLEDVRQRCGLGSDPSRLGGWHSGWYRPALNS